jgi:hypothetical protein
MGMFDYFSAARALFQQGELEQALAATNETIGKNFGGFISSNFRSEYWECVESDVHYW